jgi:hypothetical protein
VLELKHQFHGIGIALGRRVVARRLSLYERSPVRFWQIVSLLLFLALLGVLAMK